ncbi:MAG: molybdopterin molybdotransferase MoeA [Syntrophomonadaceae bacterium]|nr:molybdopterin molybdotransferase MoeA [Syntrophomonadaceae bacterium]MDD3022486.1 molybdopterin molybdotransferase MoeA [Syntrophomonadaceae bacterium]
MKGQKTEVNEVDIMGEFLKVFSFQEAVQGIKDNFAQPHMEKVNLDQANQRILAEEVLSPEDVPAFNRSVVDGYAVRAEDTFGSSESLPAYLGFVGEVIMGQAADLELLPEQCCWIPTGGMLPAACNAAVMVEYTEKLSDDTVLIYKPVGPWENIMLEGEDVKKGQIIFSAGHLIRPQDIGLLASLGITSLNVFKPLKVGLLSTGDEIINIDKKPLTGQVRDVNSFAIAAALENCGAIPRNYPLVGDDFNILKQAVERGLSENDLLIMSGGSSVGVMDVSLDVLLSFPESRLIFHGIALKPGKPTMAVKIGDKMVIGLPGHPVSALMVFYIVCSPALRQKPLLTIDARIKFNLASQSGRDDFVPVKLIEENEEIIAVPLLGKSGLMSILSMANGYIHIPYEKQGVKAGAKIKVCLF